MRYASGQTHRHTYMLLAIFRPSTGGEVIRLSDMPYSSPDGKKYTPGLMFWPLRLSYYVWTQLSKLQELGSTERSDMF